MFRCAFSSLFVCRWISSHPGQHLPDTHFLCWSIFSVLKRPPGCTPTRVSAGGVFLGTGTHARDTQQDNTHPLILRTRTGTHDCINNTNTIQCWGKSNFKPAFLCSACWTVPLVFDKEMCHVGFQVRDKCVGATQEKRVLFSLFNWQYARKKVTSR